MNITQTLAQELAATPAQITAAVALLDDGATVRPLPQRSDGAGWTTPNPSSNYLHDQTTQQNPATRH